MTEWTGAGARGEVVAESSATWPGATAGWPCPYCRGENGLEAVACAHCGAQLRDPDDDLFTTVAADNAEVVPPRPRVGPDSLWSTEAVDGELLDDASSTGAAAGPGGWTPPPQDPAVGFRPSFSAEPVTRPDDVVEEATGAGRPAANGSEPTTAPLFASDAAARVAGRSGGPGRFGDLGPSPFATPPAAARGPMAPPPPGPYPAGAGAWAPGAAPPMSPPAGAAAPPGVPGPSSRPPVPDAHGLAAAIARLRPEDQELAATPICVVGALLQPDEVVLVAVTGQMLGHPAVVVLTTRRILVVNARRWQPIVDLFEVGPELVVRGRHDADVAALSFADGSRLSTVDGITEVALAVELAERVRSE